MPAKYHGDAATGGPLNEALEQKIQICGSGTGPDSGDTKYAAAYLNLAPSTLAKMRIFGTGPAFFKLGRAVRYRREDLEEWRDRFRATSTTQADATLPRSLTSNEKMG